MKKLLAILLSALMLCAMIPFGVVASAEEYTEPTAVGIVLNEDEEEVDTVNAGDTILVQVNLLNNPGVIAVGVEVVYDHNVFEVPAPYDEDEEAYVPAIEVGTTYKASSNKYITFGPVDEENEVMQKCNVFYARGTATSNCEKEWFYTATFKVKADAISGDYTLNINFTPKSGANLDKELVNFASTTTTIHVNGTEPPSCEHTYDYDCSKNCNKCGEETRPEAEHSYFYPCDPVCQLCYEVTNDAATHNIIHVEYKAPTCTENGNIEYWTCDYCGVCWDNPECTGMPLNRYSVIIPATHTYTNAHDVECDVCFEIREIVLGAAEIIIEGGNSVSEERDGLAFKFDVAADGIVIGEDYIADYTNATVTIEGVEYKLVGMGAIANNKGYSAQTLADVDNTYVLDIPAEKVFGDYSYAVRIINIPEANLDTEITVCSYYTYECEGELITIYGEDWTTSYNNVVSNG